MTQCKFDRFFFPLSLRSLELFFATNQNNRSGDHTNDKSPRLCRKFSGPLSISSRTSSPVRTRKLSLHSPISARVGGLDLTNINSIPSSFSQSAVSSPSSAQTPTFPTPSPQTPTTTSPPPTSSSSPPGGNKTPQDQAPLPPCLPLSYPEQSPSPTTEGQELPRVDAFCGKMRRSIRRGKAYLNTHMQHRCAHTPYLDSLTELPSEHHRHLVSLFLSFNSSSDSNVL